MIGTIYNYVFGPNTLGIGVGNAALVRPQPPLVGGQPYGPKYNVHKSINTFAPAGTNPGPLPLGPQVDLRANGVYLSGDMALMALADFEAKKATK